MAIVAFHQFGSVLWPELFLIQLAARLLKAFDEGFGIGAEGPAFGDDRGQVQPIGQSREPLTSRLMPIRAAELVKVHPEAMGDLDDPFRALAEGRDQRSRAIALKGRVLDPCAVNLAAGRLIGPAPLCDG